MCRRFTPPYHLACMRKTRTEIQGNRELIGSKSINRNRDSDETEIILVVQVLSVLLAGRGSG